MDPVTDTPERGTLALEMRVVEERTLHLGGPGTVRLPAGRYVHAAGASRGLARRARRLRAGESGQRRHVDRIAPLASTRRVVLREGPPDPCGLATHLARDPRSLPVIGVGSTGCTCLTHLHAFLEAPGPLLPDLVEAWTPRVRAKP